MLTKEKIDCAILDLQNECANYMADLDCGEKSQCDKCYIPTALEALEKAEKYKWIPVKARPTTEEGQKILVSRNGHLDFGNAINEDGFYLDDWGDWSTADAWMPLPEPFGKDEQFEKGEE